MEIGIDSFVALFSDPDTDVRASAGDRMREFLAEVETADRAGVDVFGVGEHHRPEFLDSAPAVILSAAAARTTSIRLASAVTVLSAADPVRVFQEFATLDLISGGRAEMVVGRGSFGEAFPLFGYEFQDYDALFAEKLDLLLALRESDHVTWSGRHRPPLSGQGVYPRPHQTSMPVWLGVGGSPQSFVRAGTLGLPLMIAIIGGGFDRFRRSVDDYRQAGRQSGHVAGTLRVGVHAMGFVADTAQEARDLFYPGWHRMTSVVGRERGWPPPSRAQFDALCGPGGAFLVGDPTTVAHKILAADAALGGLSRITLQMSSASLNHAAMLRSIELLGSQVAPQVRDRLAAARWVP